MNAPAAAAIAAPNLQLIRLDAIAESHTHVQDLRRKRFDKKALQELAADIKARGLLQFPLVRPHPKATDKVRYELVAGERRWIASRMAGFSEIYCSVRDVSDDEALQDQLTENLRREGLHELEEAEGYEELMKLKKVNADTVADMVGRSRSYVYARTKLLALCPEARAAFYTGPDAGGIDASKALLIARIGHHDTQRQALRDITKGEYNRGPMSYREAHKHILANYMLRLRAAPFDVKDEKLLPAAGSCDQCPKRTGNQRDLFGDVKDADVCTDPKCFDDKRQAHYAVDRRKLEAQGKKLIFGEAAKKIFTEFESPNAWSRDRMQGGYVKLDETTYAMGGGRKVADVLGPDYEPVLIQHPGTGAIHKVATQQAISAAVAKRAKERPAGKKSRTQAYATPARQHVEDRTDELVGERVLKAVYDKAPKLLGQDALRILAFHLWGDVKSICRQDVQRQLGAAAGWKIKPSYSGRPPKELAKLGAKDLPRFVLAALAAIESEVGIEGAQFQRLCKSLKVDPKAIEKQVAAELKKKAEEDKAKAAAKKAKKKPAGKSKAAAKKSKGKKK
jgi:ParB/RepB/Spo0J family partition protein